MVIRCPVIKAANAPLRAAAKFTTVVAGTQTQTRKARESQAPEPFYCTTQEHCDGSDYLCPYYAFPATSSRKRTFSPPFRGADLRNGRAQGGARGGAAVVAVAAASSTTAIGPPPAPDDVEAQLREEAVMDDPI